tara:strand:- start:387 stop:956 length:570 start_codon:yes stop_codon:yes gene_type:complete
MWKYNDKTIRENKGWTDDNGVQHPRNWMVWSADEKAARGLTEITIQSKPDDLFYWVTGPNNDGSWTSTERAIEDVNEVDSNGNALLDEDGNQLVALGLKSQYISRTKSTQGSLLFQTDWAYIRKADDGTVIPTAIQNYRNAVRIAATAIEKDITDCSTMDEFKALFVIPVDSNNIPTGNAPIYDWPKGL